MPEPLPQFLSRLLAKGPFRIGQLTVTPDFVITPTDDLARTDLGDVSRPHPGDVSRPHLKIFTDPHDAIDFVRLDEAGRYRPLKPAPNLRRGWQLRLKTPAEVLLALDFIYPAAIGNAAARERDALPVTNLRETLARQSGMYAVVSKLTDAQADSLVDSVCHCGCLRRRLWTIRAGDSPEPPRDEAFPLWCPEACNLFVAAGRSVVKGPSASAH